MNVIEQVQTIQLRRIRRARRLTRHADRAHAIALHHAQSNVLISTNRTNAERGFALARGWYERARNILTGDV